VKRTQIYLEELQDERLSRRAADSGVTKSEIVRRAIERYLGNDPTQDEREIRMARFKTALDEVAGIAPYLPDGITYVSRLRKADSERQRRLEERWHGSRSGTPRS
jgi:hypothetical protein